MWTNTFLHLPWPTNSCSLISINFLPFLFQNAKIHCCYNQSHDNDLFWAAPIHSKISQPINLWYLDSSSNLCFGIPIGDIWLQPKCLYTSVSPYITHSICKCSFWVLYQMNIQYFLLCRMGVTGEQSLWMFQYKAQGRIFAPKRHEVTEQSQ